MTVGYPDYARLSESGGYQLYSHSGSVPNNTLLIKAYVGLWPYVNMFTQLAASSDVFNCELIYYSDSTFTQQVGYRYAIRAGQSFAATQYANLSPWLGFAVVSKSGNPIDFIELGLYGTTGPAAQTGLTSLDVPIFTGGSTIAAGGSVNINPLHIQPGDASLSIVSEAASWHVNGSYYDWFLGAYNQVFRIENGMGAFGGYFDIPMLDSPYEVTIANTGSANANFWYSWMSK